MGSTLTFILCVLGIAGPTLLALKSILPKKKTKSVEIPKAPKKKRSLKYKKQTFQLGMTSIEIEFVDGSKFTTWVYGTVDQMNSPSPVFAGEVRVTGSERMAELFLLELNGNRAGNYPDDPRHPTETHLGVAKHAVIGETVEHAEERSIAEVIEE